MNFRCGSCYHICINCRRCYQVIITKVIFLNVLTFHEIYIKYGVTSTHPIRTQMMAKRHTHTLENMKTCFISFLLSSIFIPLANWMTNNEFNKINIVQNKSGRRINKNNHISWVTKPIIRSQIKDENEKKKIK